MDPSWGLMFQAHVCPLSALNRRGSGAGKDALPIGHRRIFLAAVSAPIFGPIFNPT